MRFMIAERQDESLAAPRKSAHGRCWITSLIAATMREHAVMSIQKFLESRIEDDERLAREAMATTDLEDSRLALTDDGRVTATGWRMLSEVELKREMLLCHDDDLSEAPGRPTIVCVTCREPYPCQSLRIAAAVYSDHPRYLHEWRPHDPDPRTD
jgi:hypothetical protein